MKIFDQVEPWLDKVNFVDENNVVVGYHMAQNCCEYADWYITDQLSGNKPECPPVKQAFDLETYRFDPNYFNDFSLIDPDEWDNEHNMIEFRLVSGILPELRLVLFNVHNGYYGHGFTMDIGGIQKRSGVL